MRGPCCAVVVLTAVVALTAAGCTNADTNTAESTTEPTASVATATTGATATTVPATTLPSTTTPTTTTPTTTSTTTTSTTEPAPSLDELEAAVAAAYDERYEGYWACLRAPLACDTSYLLPDGGSEAAMHDTMQALADRDRYVGDDPVGYYVIESIEFNDDLTEAVVTSCWWSTAVLYTTPIDPDRPPGPDNPATVVNNTPGTAHLMDMFQLDAEGIWRLAESETTGQAPRENTCDAD